MEVPKGSKPLKSERQRAPLGRGQTEWIPPGQGLGPERCSGRWPKAVEGAEHATEGRPEKKTTGGGAVGSETIINGWLRGIGGSGCPSARPSGYCDPNAAVPREPPKGA